MRSSSAKKKIRISCIQVNAGSNIHKNITSLEGLLKTALKVKPDIVAFPENFLWRGSSENLEGAAQATKEVLGDFRSKAKRCKTAFLLGSLIEASQTSRKYYNTSYWISASGRVSATYRKIHLFDVELSKDLSVQESKHILPGHKPVLVSERGIVSGLSICYDLRFPELYRRLTHLGAQILFVPANFTRETGKAHWKVLLRARAIENQCFVVAPAQVGKNPSNGITSYGHSLMVDPWGRVLFEGSGASQEVLTADADFSVLNRVRRLLPALRHRVLNEV